jgi:hypothetical protein
MATKKKALGKMPASAIAFFQATGAMGGKAKVPKGLGTMSEEKKQKVLAAALKARRKNAKARAKNGAVTRETAVLKKAERRSSD